VDAIVIRTLRFNIESNACLDKALEVFKDMVNEMLKYGLENEVYSATELEKHFWNPFKDKYRLATHYTTSASRYAASLLQSHLSNLKAWNANRKPTKEPSPPKQKKLCMRLQTILARPKLVNGKLELHITITTKPKKEHVKLALQPYSYAEPLVKAWAAEELKVGEITIKPSEVYIPFKQKVTCNENPIGAMFFDTNLSSLDFVVATKNGVFKAFSLDISLIQKIRQRYAEKRKRIQNKVKNPKDRKRLWEKYEKREKRRVNHLLHLVSSLVAGISERYGGLCAVFGDLTGIRNSINELPRTKELRHQLNLWPFERLQQLCEFKLLQKPLLEGVGLAA